MNNQGEAFYCRWCGRSWPTRTRLNRHYGQAQLCAQLRWGHLARLVQETHAAAQMNLAIPVNALAPRETWPSTRTSPEPGNPLGAGHGAMGVGGIGSEIAEEGAAGVEGDEVPVSEV
jgi:hypothetical protein